MRVGFGGLLFWALICKGGKIELGIVPRMKSGYREWVDGLELILIFEMEMEREREFE